MLKSKDNKNVLGFEFWVSESAGGHAEEADQRKAVSKCVSRGTLGQKKIVVLCSKYVVGVQGFRFIAPFDFAQGSINKKPSPMGWEKQPLGLKKKS